MTREADERGGDAIFLEAGYRVPGGVRVEIDAGWQALHSRPRCGESARSARHVSESSSPFAVVRESCYPHDSRDRPPTPAGGAIAVAATGTPPRWQARANAKARRGRGSGPTRRYRSVVVMSACSFSGSFRSGVAEGPADAVARDRVEADKRAHDDVRQADEGSREEERTFRATLSGLAAAVATAVSARTASDVRFMVRVATSR